MMTHDAAIALLTELAMAEAAQGRQLNYIPDGSLAYCPVCGTANMKNFKFKFAVLEGRDPVAQRDGLMLVFFIEHPGQPKRCLFGLAGAPEQGGVRQLLLSYGEALQTLNLELLMRGEISERKSS